MTVGANFASSFNAAARLSKVRRASASRTSYLPHRRQVAALRALLAEAGAALGRPTFGVSTFLHSGWGGALFDSVTGARALRRRLAARGASYANIIGQGDGPALRAVARLMREGRVRAIIDKRYALDEARAAIAYQRAGHVAGKVVVVVVPEDAGSV